jgi:phospholipid transport system substrate-binding protein
MAGLPTDQVRQTADKVLLILQDPRFKSTDMREVRKNQLRQVISARFDFQQMAQRSLGPHWQRRREDERRDFVELFTELLEKTYADQIAAYDGEKIVYGRESQDKDYAEVDTKIVTNKGEEFSVNYKLRSSSGEWKVYDVVIENISLVNNYRSQFNRVLANSSFDDLLRKMREKQFVAPQTKGKM